MIKPCYRFTNNSPRKQFLRFLIEVLELSWSVIKLDRQGIAEEAVDCMVALATLLACIGMTTRERAAMERFVWSKNYDKGYYNKDGD